MTSPRLLRCGFVIGSLCAFGLATSTASTGFRVGPENAPGQASLYAISTGWHYPVRAIFSLNRKNLHKVAESFGDKAPPFEWVSRYGSVTQSMTALEFPMSGVNERGLTIQATVLKGKPLPTVPAGGTGIHRLQWIQFQLDTSATLAEVIQKSVTLKQPLLTRGGKINAQYQVCDPHDCANLAFFDDKAVAQGSIGRVEVNWMTGKTQRDPRRWPLSVIANHPYDESIGAYQRCTSFPCRTGDDSFDRFIEASERLKSFAALPLDATAAMLKAFDDLKSVDQGYPLTTWNEVYQVASTEPGKFEVLFSYKSPSKPIDDRQWIHLRSPDFACRKAAKVWWLDMDRAGGERTAEAVVWNAEVQRQLVGQHGSQYSKEQQQALIDYAERKTSCVTPGS
jgi:hypothetical protein